MAKRIAQSSINWSAIAERVPPNQRTNFIAFKSRSDKYLRSVMANPEVAPKIDWAYYKNRVAVPALVDAFQKGYESVKIPYPNDTLTAQVEQQAKQVKQEIEQFCSTSRTRIAAHEKDIAHLKSLIPYDQMTMEDFRDSHPELALNAIDKPTFWPHEAREPNASTSGGGGGGGH